MPRAVSDECADTYKIPALGTGSGSAVSPMYEQSSSGGLSSSVNVAEEHVGLLRRAIEIGLATLDGWEPSSAPKAHVSTTSRDSRGSANTAASGGLANVLLSQGRMRSGQDMLRDTRRTSASKGTEQSSALLG
jgi:hypothetical protein